MALVPWAALMLTIRDEQMRVFEAARVDRFVDATVARIAHEHPVRYGALGPEGTRALVRQGIARAKTYAIEETGAVGAFIDLMLTIHPEFELQPGMEEVREVLEDVEVSGETRLEIVREDLPAAVPGVE
ncbi:MAG TPA: hypothetical protein VGL81_25380 [Polyangiaceae bacterium]|jgi:hypothetical protein